MALRHRGVKGLAITLAIGAAASILTVSARAQFFDDRYPSSDQRYRRAPQSRENFFPFFERPQRSAPQGPYIRAPQPTEATKAPSPTPRKPDAPPVISTVIVVGDSMAEWLAYGLEESYAADAPDVGVVRNVHPVSGLVRYDPRNDTLEWSQAVKDTLGADKPGAIVVMLGLNDRMQLRDRTPPRPGPQPGQPSPQGPGAAQSAPPDSAAPSDGAGPAPAPAEAQRSGPGNLYDFHTDKWEEIYSKRIDDMIAVLKSKGAPVVWVGLPSIRGAKSTSDMSYLNDLYRARAEKAGIAYVDIWDGFVDDKGNFTLQGPDFEGQTRRLRTYDGVNFTKYGALKLAHYVEQQLGRVLSNRLTPVALPTTDETLGKASNAGPRPLAGPVLPLAAAANTDGNELIGASGRAAPLTPDPTAVKVLSRGDSIAPPSGRADDFTWPRPGADANGTADVAPDPIAPVMPAPPKGSAVKKAEDPKTKTKPTPDPATAVRPRPSATGGPAAAGTTVR
jgi:uncharacterized protein